MLLFSYLHLIPPSHTSLSYLPLIPASHTSLSYRPLIPPSHTSVVSVFCSSSQRLLSVRFSYGRVPVCWIVYSYFPLKYNELLQVLKVKVKLDIIVLRKLSIFMNRGRFSFITTHPFLLLHSLFSLTLWRKPFAVGNSFWWDHISMKRNNMIGSSNTEI